MTIASEEAAMLYRLAGQDALAFATLIGNPDIELRIACFHGQQAVEKFLKAVLVAQGIAFLPTHNLARLAELLHTAGVARPVSTEAQKRLNPYAVAFRYDDRDIHTLTREEATAIVRAVADWTTTALSA